MVFASLTDRLLIFPRIHATFHYARFLLRRRGCVLLCPLAMAAGAPPQAALLPVTSRAVVDSSIYVSADSGSDMSSGTAAAPLKTVSRAVAVAMGNYHKGLGTVIHVGPGTYREAVTLVGSGDPLGPPISLIGDPNGRTYLSGSTVWTGWQQTDVKNVYQHIWPYKWGECSIPSGWPRLKSIVRRREMVFVDGRMLTQELSRAAMAPDTFYVDDDVGVLYICLQAARNIASARIEVSTLPLLLLADHLSNLSISNITFEHANPCVNSTAASSVLIENAANVTLLSSSFDWNNWVGLAIFNSTNVTVQWVTANHNGELGFNGYRLRHLLMRHIDTSHNDWRGAWGDYDTWEAGGGKFLRTHGAEVADYVAVENGGRGMWFDTDNRMVTVSHALISHNTQDGMFLEKNEGPLIMTESTICGNRTYGLRTNSEEVSLVRDAIFDNDSAQLYVDESEGTPIVKDFETGVSQAIRPVNLVLREGTYTSPAAAFLIRLKFMTPSDASSFFSSLQSSDNSWRAVGTAPMFFQSVGGTDTRSGFSEWQIIARQDSTSRYASDAPPQVCPEAR